MIDRPLGSTHPDGGFQYRLNYGLVPEYIAPDGEALDAYVVGPDGPVEMYEGEVVGVVLRSDDVEDKLIVSAEPGWTTGQLEDAVAFQEQFFESRVITGS